MNRFVTSLVLWAALIMAAPFAITQEPLPSGCGSPLEAIGYRIITRGNTADLENVINTMREMGWTLVGPVATAIGPFPGPDGQPYEMHTATLMRPEPE